MKAHTDGRPPMRILSTGRMWYLCLSLVMMLAATVAISPVAGQGTAAFVQGNNQFAVDLYEQLSSGGANVTFSPYCVSEAMAMAYAGARGATAKEMRQVLRFPTDVEMPSAFKEMNERLIADGNRDGQKLTIANGFCGTHEDDVSPSFKALLNREYDAELFSGDLKQINGWVSRKTDQHVRRVLDYLDTNSVCVLLNAVYFKGLWEQQFDKAATRDGAFKLSNGGTATALFMNQRKKYRMMEYPECQVISLPYTGNRFSLVIVLPKDVNGLNLIERKLSAAVLQAWFTDLALADAEQTQVMLPRLKFESRYDLVTPFKSLGLKDAFTNGKPDFSGMGPPPGVIWINQIQHAAYLAVEEEGTEASAATAVEMTTKSEVIERSFIADHPFLFLIRHNETGTVLFIGRVTNPGG